MDRRGMSGGTNRRVGEKDMGDAPLALPAPQPLTAPPPETLPKRPRTAYTTLYNSYQTGHGGGGAMATGQELRKSLLNAKKTERVIFAITPELKEAATAQAEDRCVSLSAYINSLIADDVVAHAVAEAKASNKKGGEARAD